VMVHRTLGDHQLLGDLAVSEPRATRAATSVSRRVRASGGSSTEGLRFEADATDGTGSSLKRAYSTACSSVNFRPSANVTSHAFSPSWVRAVATWGSSIARSSDGRGPRCPRVAPAPLPFPLTSKTVASSYPYSPECVEDGMLDRTAAYSCTRIFMHHHNM
jgi:hypothetical protein